MNDRISTGIASLNMSLEGGYKIGGVTSVHHRYDISIDDIIHAAVRTAQYRDRLVGYISTRPFDVPTAVKHRVDIDRLLVMQCCEMRKIKFAIRNSATTNLDLLVIDDLGGIASTREDDDGWGERDRLMQRLRGRIRLPKTAVIVIQVVNAIERFRDVPSRCKRDDRAIVVDRDEQRVMFRIISPRSLKVDRTVKIPMVWTELGIDKDAKKVLGLTSEESKLAVEHCLI